MRETTPPEASSFLTARWLQLAMINYEVDRRVLDALDRRTAS